MHNNWRLVVAFAPALLLLSCTTQAQEAPTNSVQSAGFPVAKPSVTRPEPGALNRILFVGNSYMYYNDSLHNHVKRMGSAAGIFEASPAVFKSATIGGAALRDHAIDHLLDPKNLRVDDPFGLVIMQGISSAGLTPNGRQRFAETAISYAEKVRRAGGQPVLYMTPAYAKAHRRYRPSMTNEVASLYIETGNQANALVIPVGLAFEEAIKRRPGIVLHNANDHSHPSLLGSYLAAATVVASVYEVSPVGNSYDAFGKVSAEDARFLQEVAQDTVVRFYGRAD